MATTTATTATTSPSSYPTAVMGDGGSEFDDSDDWWAYPTAIVVKWAIIGGLCLGMLAFVLGGYLHAQRRMKKGKAPLRYHRFLLPNRQLRTFYAAHPSLPESQAYFQRHQQQQSAFFAPPYGPRHSDSAEAGVYAMGSYMRPPPPAYVQEDYVPAYTPREEGNSKVNPDQNYQGTPGVAAVIEGQTTTSAGTTSQAGRP